jgi:AmiR/NasT family two-component response regulator
VPAHLNPDDAAAFARLSQELAGEPDTEQTVQRVVETAQMAIPGCDYAGFTLTHRDRLETAAATDPVITQLDQAQHDLGEGPCLEAARTEETYLIRDTADEPRWPRWSARAAEAGVRSVLSVQLTGPEHLHAAMNLYSTKVDAYDEDAILTAQIYATHAGNAIAATNQTDQLQTALRTRHLIGLAQGMLMMRYSLTEEQAFRFLARNSQDTNTKLRDVAAKLIAELRKQGWPKDS